MNHRLFRPAITLLAGALLPLSLAPWHWWPAALASVATLALLLRGATAQQAYWRTFLFSFAMFAVGASWVFVSMNTYGDLSVPISVLLTTAFVTLLSLIFSLPFLLIGVRPNQSRTVMLLGFPAIWVIAEWFIGWIFTGFPWIYLGYGHLHSWLAGWAPVTGVWGISWIVAFCSAIIALCVSDRAPLFNRARITAISMAIILWVTGYALQSVQWTTPDKPLRVGLLQPNIPQLQRWQSDSLESILGNNLILSQPLWGSDLVVWPEAAIPEYRHNVEALLRDLDALARHHNSAFITGVLKYTLEDNRYYNTVVALGQGNGEYLKQHLVPIGEYVPMGSLLRKLGGFFDLPMSGFTSGEAGQPLLTAGQHRIATAICYEIAYPELVRALATEASIILTVSNDTWFGDSLGPQHHLAMAQMRALENRKPAIRATNDGVTALINHRGQITDSLPQFTEGILQGEVTPRHGVTPYNRIGSWPILVFAVFCLGWCIFQARQRTN